MKRIALFGGSFDPPHLGHINTALAVRAHFTFDKFLFLPCKTPVLKTATVARPEQRVDMLELAIAPYPNFGIDTREIMREGPSYMVDTLKSLREELGTSVSITLVLGMDAFISLPQWHQFEDILTLSHLLVLNRPGTNNLTKPLYDLLELHEITDKQQLLTSSHGNIFLFDAGHYMMSSSHIREKLGRGEDVSNELPTAVNQYLKKWSIYHG